MTGCFAFARKVLPCRIFRPRVPAGVHVVPVDIAESIPSISESVRSLLYFLHCTKNWCRSISSIDGLFIGSGCSIQDTSDLHVFPNSGGNTLKSLGSKSPS